MKKIRKLATKLLITTMVLISGMSMTVYGMTAKEVTAKTPKSYVTGTNSVYGPKLSQAQLNSVAQATADFMNKKITKNMTTDAKILVAYNHIKNNTTYVDWNAVEGANTAYTLVTKKGACSGMARSMKALCDAMGIESYYVHSTSNDHQWNLIRFGDGRLYHVDIDANKSAGKDVIYKSLSHPLPFDKTAYPTVGAVAQT
ncbi:TPA: transglutaminase domain-containing protein, partial [Clostridioides difficile]|nr:transglutaminase domain-containing protein [Clostridioides difficile]